MSFQSQGNLNERQSRQNILQELQQQKQQLLQQGQVAGPIQVSAAVTPVPNPQRLYVSRSSTSQDQMRSHPESLHSSAAAHSRRTALEYASAHSNGYFVSVADSQFGNHILPGIPRLDEN